MGLELVGALVLAEADTVAVDTTVVGTHELDGVLWVQRHQPFMFNARQVEVD